MRPVALLIAALCLAAPSAAAAPAPPTASRPYSPEVDELIRVAHAAMAAKHYEQAWMNYREAGELMPDDEAIAGWVAKAQQLTADAYVATGRAHLAARRYTEALYAFEGALEVQPRDAAAAKGKHAAEAALAGRGSEPANK